MQYKNTKACYKNHANTTSIVTATSSALIFVLMIAVVLSFVAGWILTISTHRVNAQMDSSSNNMAGSLMSNSSSSNNINMGSNMMAIPAKAPQLNISTAAPPISPAMFKSLASQMHVDLINATMIAQNWVGSNSHAVSSMVAIQDGSPVYTIWVIDNNSGLHQIVVDAQSGKVMFANQPMSMTGPFS